MKLLAGLLLIAITALFSGCGSSTDDGEGEHTVTGRSATIQEIDDLRNSI